MRVQETSTTMPKTATPPETVVDMLRFVTRFPSTLTEAERMSSERFSVVSSKTADFSNPKIKFVFEMTGGSPCISVLTFGANSILIELKSFDQWDPDATFKLGAKKP